MKKIIPVITLQVILILYLTLRIYEKTKILGTVSVTPLNKVQLTTNTNSKLQYYFEPMANTIASETAQLKWMDPNVKYTINSDTLNETHDYQVEKPEGTYRIVALGDSFTFGLFVNTYQNWTTVLENELNSKCTPEGSFEVLNLGVSGNDIQYGVERFRTRGTKYSPDLVIWLLKRDDYTDINELMRKNEELYTQEMKNDGEYTALLDQGVPNPVLAKMIDDMTRIRKDLGQEKMFSLQTSYFQEIYSLLRGKFLIVFIPFEMSPYQQYFKRIAEDRSDTYYLELPNTNNDARYTFSPYNSHPSIEGHRMIADKIFEYLNQQNLVVCN